MRPTTKATRLAVALLLAFAPAAVVPPQPALAVSPANDDFAEAQVLTGSLPITITGTNLDATVEPGEPEVEGFPAEASVWYAWTADVTGRVEIEACESPLVVRLAVYTGDTLATIAPVGDVPPRGCISYSPSRVIETTAGTTYRIAVNGTFGDQASFELRLRQLQPPPNDDFSDAQELDGLLPISTPGTNVDATAQPGEPHHGGLVPAWSVWFTWTPAVTESVLVQTCAAQAGATLDVYTGDVLDALAPVGVRVNRGACTYGSVMLDAVAGTTYRFAVDALGFVPGSFELLIRHPSPPANDDFADAQVLEGTLPIAVAGSNVDATNESGEPLHASNEGGSSVWFSWTAPMTGRVAVDACDAGFSTLLAVYTGDAMESLVEVTSRLNFGSCVPSIIEASAGTTYRIALDGALLSLGIGQGAFALAIRPIVPPANDDFADRIVLAGPLPIQASGTNVDATTEPGETPPGGVPGGASVWWSWTATVSELVAIDTCESDRDFDTTLAVYTGDDLASLTPIAGNDDFPGCQLRSLVSFQAIAGITYHVQVDGFFGDTGAITLAIEGPPPNDDFADAQALEGALPVLVSSSNARATKEAGEPNHAGNVGGHSVWYAWTPSVSETVEIGTCLDAVDSLVAVYTGDTLVSLTEVDSNHAGCFPGAFVTIEAVAGTTYRIAVDDYTGLGSSYGDFTLRIAAVRPPANDAFADAETLAGDLTIHAAGTNIDATREPGEPNHTADAGGASVWFEWTASESGFVGVDTCGSDFDTLLAVYTGSSVGSLTQLASNDDFSGCSLANSLVLFAAAAGTTYHIAIDGWGRAQGHLLLHVREAGTPPNDDFGEANHLGAVLPVDAAGTNMEASREPDEPDHAGSRGLSSVWYAWTAPRPEPVVVDTCGATFNTLLGVYTGADIGALTEIASSDDSEACATRSLVAFDAAGGTTYDIAVDGSPANFTRWSVGYFDLSIESACTETVTGPWSGTLKASAGIVCLHDARVDGPIRVGPGAQLWVVDSEVVGPVTADGAGRVVVCGSSVDGPVRLLGGSGVTLGDPELGCLPNSFDGSVTVAGTAGPSVLAGNTITGKLACTGNSPAPVDRGTPNLVTGPATGQCAPLGE